MWNPMLLLLLVASAMANAEADADPEPRADPDPKADPALYLSRSWASDLFGSPVDTRLTESTSSPSYGFAPALPPQPAFLAIGNVRAAPPSVVALRKPATVFRQPLVFLAPGPAPPFFFHTIHIRVPDTTADEAQPVPAAAPALASFATQHTAQQPIRPQTFFPTLTIFPHVVAAPLPAFASRHTAQVPLSAPSSDGSEEEEASPAPLPPHQVILAHFPTQLASFTPNLRDEGSVEPVAPAGIAQSLQPTFFTTSFRNDFAHPTLHDKHPSTDGTVIEA